KLEQRGPFLWLRGVGDVAVRLRGGDCPVTSAELIAPEEYRTAIRLVLERELGLQKEALAASTVRLMGFRRSGRQLRTAIEREVDWLVQQGELQSDSGGFLILCAPQS